jgi:hypothetical protein
LRDLLQRSGLIARLAGYGETEDLIRRAILNHYARAGHAPTPAKLALDTGMTSATVAETLRALERRDLVILEPADGGIEGAYPFTERSTGHRLRVGARWLNAMCAIDALGAGAMLRRDVEICSSCRCCGQAIELRTTRVGTSITQAAPPDTMVWADLRYCQQAATSLCGNIVFLCSAAHLAAWRETRPAAEGTALSLAEALQVGRALFAPSLAPSPAAPRALETRPKGRIGA